MFQIFLEKPKRTLGIFLVVTLIASAYLLYTVRLTLDENDGQVGALLDDTWIHVRFADHLAQGKGLSYNDSTLTTGATSPFWVLALAAIYVVTNPSVMQQVDIAIALGAIWHVLSIIAITGFGWWATRKSWIGLAAGTLTALTGRFMWMGLSGMETTAFTAFCIITLWSHLEDIQQNRAFSQRTAILAAITSLVRPEAYFLCLLIGLDAFVLIPIRERIAFQGILKKFRRAWTSMVSYLVLASAYPIACLLIDDYPLPNTFRAKSFLGKTWPDLPREFFWTPLRDQGWGLVILAAIGTVYLLWRSSKKGGPAFLWPLWPILFVLVVLFLGPERYIMNHGRYVTPAIPFHALIAVIGIDALLQGFQHPRLKSLRLYQPATRSFLSGILVFILGIFIFNRGFYNADQVSNDVSQLRKMHVAVGYWFQSHTTPDQLIALNDIGAIAHVSDRRILDLEGLVSPEVIDATKGTERFTCENNLQLARLMLKEPPFLLALFPGWYPCLTSWPGALQPITVFTITGPTVIAGGEMVIYWPLWQNWPILVAAPDDALSIQANFQDGVELLSYRAEKTPAGLKVTLWWQAHKQPDADYHIFVHLVGADGTQISQHDSQPQNDQFHMSWWRSGDIIRDEHIIPLTDASVLDQEGLSLRIGVYHYPDGRRLLRTDTQPDHPDFTQIPLVLTYRIFG
ncbi:MAG: hypothetical protein DPW16_01270 [Chloroflexi bacterium]|nr:hypothetical protein [Chloroflexota bacterium]